MDQAEGRAGFRVSGRVQGVGFRWWTVREAHRLGLRGTVRNHPDGTVEVHAAGSDAALSRLAVRLREGPPHARVDRVEPVPPTPTLPPDFRVIA
jgi:acylphosphatase